jgi:hypothetical protein
MLSDRDPERARGFVALRSDGRQPLPVEEDSSLPAVMIEDIHSHPPQRATHVQPAPEEGP